MPIDRSKDAERRARVAALIEHSRQLAIRAERARSDAAALLRESAHIVRSIDADERRRLALDRVTEALDMAKAENPIRNIAAYRHRKAG